MRKIEIGEAELRIVRLILSEAESNVPHSRLTAAQKNALRTFLRRLSFVE